MKKWLNWCCLIYVKVFKLELSKYGTKEAICWLVGSHISLYCLISKSNKSECPRQHNRLLMYLFWLVFWLPYF